MEKVVFQSKDGTVLKYPSTLDFNYFLINGFNRKLALLGPTIILR